MSGASDEDGGCIYALDSGLSLLESSLIDCRSLGDGGSMWVGGDSILNIERTTFSNSAARGHGGVLYLTDNSSATIRQVEFSSSDSPKTGGTICASSASKVEISNANFSLHQARGGGALSILNESVASLVNASFTFCGAYGGTPQDVEAEDDKYTLRDVAAGGGVALVMMSSSLSLINCVLEGSLASQHGGAVSVGTRCSLHLQSCQFVSNLAAGLGGVARFGHGSRLSGSNNLFEYNRAVSGGGVFAFTSSGSGSLRDSRYSFNTLGCLGCKAQKEYIFAICLDPNQRVSEGYDIMLMQPCRGLDCAYVQCWGVPHLAWLPGCSFDSAGWRSSGKDRCGADKYPFKLYINPDTHWAQVEAASQQAFVDEQAYQNSLRLSHHSPASRRNVCNGDKCRDEEEEEDVRLMVAERGAAQDLYNLAALAKVRAQQLQMII